MEQRHMQEKSRGAARPDVDARARAIQEQIIHIPRPAQPGNARPAAQSTAGHPSGAQQRPPQAARPRDDACAQRRRAAPAPAHTAPRGQAAGGRHYAAKPRKRRRAPGGYCFGQHPSEQRRLQCMAGVPCDTYGVQQGESVPARLTLLHGPGGLTKTRHTRGRRKTPCGRDWPWQRARSNCIANAAEAGRFWHRRALACSLWRCCSVFPMLR